MVLFLVAGMYLLMAEQPYPIRFLFPKNVFALGAEGERYRRRVELRSKLLWGVVVALLVGVVVTLLTNPWVRR